MRKKLSQDEIKSIENTRPHVVILGAGATMATIPHGDKNGRPCSVMHGFMQNIGLESILQKVNLDTQSENIEDIYTELYERGEECKEVRLQLEDAIFSYFSKLQLPDEITIYDKLVLALTSKDLIATFNWDPLLIQAYNRASKITKNRPKLTFLHGNVAIGYCEKCNHFGALQRGKCNNCGTPYQKSPLLYPVKHKDYNTNFFIKQEWNILTNFLNRAKMVTIIGYSAPKSDVEAAQLLKEAFKKYLPAKRFSHIDIIERPGFNHNELSNTWQEFIHDSECTYKIHDSFYDSYLAKSPRRTIECLYKRNIMGWWGESAIKFKEHEGWSDVEANLLPLFSEEELGKKILDVNPVTPYSLLNSLIELDKASEKLSEEEFYKRFENANFRCRLRNPVKIEDLTFYRSRLVSSVNEKEDITSPSTFSYIPLEKSQYVKRGRMNKKGQSMFYASLSPETNYCEIKHDVQEGEEIYLSQWRMKKGSSLNIYPVSLPDNISVNVDLTAYLGIKNPFFVEGIMGDYLKKLAYLFTREEPLEDQQYLCSSFLANYILQQKGKATYNNQEYDIYYDAIVYPSARKGQGEIMYSNIAIPPHAVDACLELVYVIKGKLEKDLSSITFEQIGFCNDNKVKWYNIQLYPDNVVFKNIKLIDKKNNSVEIDKHLCCDSEGKQITSDKLYRFIRETLTEKLLESVIKNKISENKFSYSEVKYKNDFVKRLEFVCLWPVNSWSADGQTIEYIQLEVDILTEPTLLF